MAECLYWTLYNPALWLMGLTLGPILNAYLTFLPNGSQLIMTALGATAAVFLGLSAYAVTRAAAIVAAHVVEQIDLEGLHVGRSRRRARDSRPWPGFGRHEAGRGEECADALFAPRPHDRNVRDAAVGDPPLRAVDGPVAAASARRHSLMCGEGKRRFTRY